MRTLRWIATGVVAALALAFAFFVAAAWVRLAALFAVPQEGMFGATWADFRLRPGELAGLQAKQRSLNATATALYYSSLGLVLSSAVATAWCGWQTRHDVRSWHWPSFIGLACLASLFTLGSHHASTAAALLPMVALDLVALGASVFDLTRRRYGSPGRIIAWTTLVLALGAGAWTYREAVRASVSWTGRLTTRADWSLAPRSNGARDSDRRSRVD